MKESNYVRKLLIASAVLVLGIPAIASATPLINDEGKPVVRVSYADLNLSNEAGVATLYRRIQSATSAVCGPQRSFREAGSQEQLRHNKQCYRDTVSKIVAKINNPLLDKVHAGKKKDQIQTSGGRRWL